MLAPTVEEQKSFVLSRRRITSYYIVPGPSGGRVTPRGRRSTTVNEANIMTVSDYDPVTGLEVFR